MKNKANLHLRRKQRRQLARARKLALRKKKLALLHTAAFTLAPLAKAPAGSNIKVAHRLHPPKSLNLSNGYADTVKFLDDVRVVTSAVKRVWVDFTKITEITPAGALLLVAEFDRWKDKTKFKRLSAFDLNSWNPSVRKRLKDMGFFTVLNALCDVADPDDPEGEQFLPFFTGHRSEGDKAKKLRIAVEGLGATLRDSGALYDGLIEAMTNVEHHAYAAKTPEWARRWWMSASVNASRNRLTVMFVDHGLTIPRTLPKSDLWERIRAKLAAIRVGEGLIKDDANLIEAAISVERSQLEEGHRGNGLKRDIQGYVEQHEAVGRLRIISGKGQYVFQKQSGAPDKVELKSLHVAFRGTFIEWTIEDYAASESS